MSEKVIGLPPGTLLSNGGQTYRIVRTLGIGGFGITYLVEAQTQQNGTIYSFYYALKEHFVSRICERELGTSKMIYSNPVAEEVQNSLRDFISEAKRLQQVADRHDNIVKVSDVFEANNTAYYVMEYLQGQSLRDYVQSQPSKKLSEKKMLELMRPIIDAVGYLHANNMTHLDIKPDNIMLTSMPDGRKRPVLIDFGLSKHYDNGGSPTSTINTLGCSDGYSPIEQYGGITSFQPTADIYALGATMLYCLTGNNPRKSTEMQPGEARKYTSSLSPALGAILERMLSQGAAGRPQSIREVFAALDAQKPTPPPFVPQADDKTKVLNPGASYVYPGMAPNPTPGPAKPKSKTGLWVALGIAAFILIGGIVAFILKNVVFGEGLRQYDRGDLISEYWQPNVDDAEFADWQGDIDAIDAPEAPLQFTLMWDASKDMDLAVVTPEENEIYYIDLEDPITGGQHQGDVYSDGIGRETVVFYSPTAGTYDVFARSPYGFAEGDNVPVRLLYKLNGSQELFEANIEFHEELGEGGYYMLGSFELSADDVERANEIVGQDTVAIAEPVDVEEVVVEEPAVEEPAVEQPAMPRWPITNANRNDGNFSGDAVSTYARANTSTASDSQALRRARNARGSGSLKVTLLWDSSNDLDLIANQADGTDIYYINESDSGSGATFSGDDTGGSNSYESVSWTNPQSGTYDMFVRVRGTVPSAGIPVQLVVTKNGSSTVYSTLIKKSGSDSKDVRMAHFSFTGSGRGNDGTYPVTNANSTSGNFGGTVTDYAIANTSTAYDSNAVSRANNVAASGRLKVTLLWDSSNDLDLIANQANGDDIYFGQTTNTSYGGRFSGDNRGGRNSYESISWTNPGSGTYDIFVRVRGTVPSSGIPVRLVVTKNGNSTVYSTTIKKSGSDSKDVRMAHFSY